MTQTDIEKEIVVIIGAGPAGLTASYLLGKENVMSIVLEQDDIVGGISRTVKYKGYHFDIGGHRFFTKVDVVDEFWKEVLPADDFLTRNRMSRIYYNKKFFHYPLRPSNALSSLGLWNSFLIGLSYMRAQFFPSSEEKTFDQWVTNRFGKRLYETFFKTYTEKVWGIPCSEISADWAAQRIKGLSLFTALKNALIQPKLDQTGNKDRVIKTLIDSFQYPKRGPGMIWEAVAKKVHAFGGEIRMESRVDKIIYEDGLISGVEILTTRGRETVSGTQFISSMPIRTLLNQFSPRPPQEVLEAADRLSYRDFLTVALIIRNPEVFPDNWIYIHDPDVKVGRIQNFKNWSPHMVPDQSMTCLGLEYFCFEGDGLWSMTDENLLKLGKEELEELNLVQGSEIIDGCVVRMPKAYPVYDGEYREALKIIRSFTDEISNLQLVGRNGMHRYNNQDHSMLTAMLAVRNICGANYDLWKVNDDNSYHEEVREGESDGLGQSFQKLDSTQPSVPRRVSRADA